MLKYLIFCIQIKRYILRPLLFTLFYFLLIPLLTYALPTSITAACVLS